MSGRLPPIGFWSYARQDDEASQGRLSSLRSILMSELQQQYGRQPIRIFQDVGSIPPGAEWESKIRVAMQDSSFLIPIITPNFLQSRWCNEELSIFREREKVLKSSHPQLKEYRLIFPIHYVDSRDVDPYDPDILKELHKLQWFDFRAYRLKDYGQESVRERMATLAHSLRDLLRIRLEDTAGRPAEDEAKTVWPGADVQAGANDPAPPRRPDPGGGTLWAELERRLKWWMAAPVVVALLIVIVALALRHPSNFNTVASAQPPVCASDSPPSSAAAAATSAAAEPAPPAPVASSSESTVDSGNPLLSAASPSASSSVEDQAQTAPPVVSDPSFNCSHVTRYVERMICSDTGLASADREYDQLYRSALSNDATGVVRSKGRAELRARNDCLDRACIADWYRGRIALLRNQ